MADNPPKIAPVIAGPTAVGKSTVAELLAERIGGEIISADARQLYRGMAIGTAAATDSNIPTHLTGVLYPKKRPTAAWWSEHAAEIMREMRSRGKFPIIVGGTGLYIEALTEGIFDAPAADFGFREELQNRAESGENLHAELKKSDPEAAERIHPNNLVRIIRALEIYHITGKPISEHFAATRSPVPDWEFAKFYLTRPREELYDRIERRARQMLESGWIEEVRKLLESGVSPDDPGMEAIGYRQIADYLAGKVPRRETLETIVRETRRYAKRQMTWFRNRSGFSRIDLSKISASAAAERIRAAIA